jgi:predicted DNA-binding transcriptional regulator AlpA
LENKVKPKTQTTAPPPKLLSAQEIVSAIHEASGLTFVTKKIFNMSRAGTFPEPAVQLNRKSIFWSATELRAWIEENFVSVT